MLARPCSKKILRVDSPNGRCSGYVGDEEPTDEAVTLAINASDDLLSHGFNLLFDAIYRPIAGFLGFHIQSEGLVKTNGNRR
jgi:hypothetical protein